MLPVPFTRRRHRPLLTPEPIPIPLGRLDFGVASAAPRSDLSTVASSNDTEAPSFISPRIPQRKKSILKMTDTQTPPRKLQKKRVTFTPSTAGESDDVPVTPVTPGNQDIVTPYDSYYPEYEPVLTSIISIAPPTPDPTPPGDEKKLKKRSSWLRKLRLTNPDPEIKLPPAPTPTGTGDDWHHHPSYFPEYEPIYPPVPTADPWPRAYHLTPAEMTAQQHSKALGHAVAIHYPDLPSWAAYTGGGKEKTKTGWTSGKWGVEG